MKKMMLMLSKGSDVSKKKKKETSQLKELLAIFHVFEHRKDKTMLSQLRKQCNNFFSIEKMLHLCNKVYCKKL